MQNKSQSEIFFEKYRLKLKEAEEMSNELKKAESKVSSMRKDISSIYSEISAMRSIITDMIDNGWDPVETQLKRDTTNIKTTFWDIIIDDNAPATYIDTSVGQVTCRII